MGGGVLSSVPTIGKPWEHPGVVAKSQGAGGTLQAAG